MASKVWEVQFDHPDGMLPEKVLVVTAGNVKSLTEAPA